MAKSGKEEVVNIDFDVNNLTLGEMEDFEEAVGASVFEVLAQGKITTKALIAFVWLTKRRDDENYTLEDARKVKVSSVEWTGADEEEDKDEDPQ